jgi:hypothetical protein
MRLSICIDDEQHRVESVVACFTLDFSFLKPAMQPLDRWDGESHVLTRVLCTPDNTIKATEKDRKRIAEMIGRQVEGYMLDYFSRNDTTMGYKNI